MLASKVINRAREGFIKAGYGSSIKKKTLLPPHPLTNFKIQSITRMNLDLMVFILELIYQIKQRMGHM